MIQTNTLRVDYDDITAVNDLSLDIAEGQIFGLLGPNGAGKTSTIKALAGIIEPTYGEIRIAGHDLELDHQNALQELGYMPDFPPVYENLKVWEYLDVFAAAYHIPSSNRLASVKHWLTRVNLMKKWDSYTRDLSRGMRQRLVLAKTLIHNPKVLLLDEPASGLDPLARKEMRDILKSIAKEGKTIVISSHILTELSDFCSSVGIMEEGRMVVSGNIADIRNQMGSKGTLIIRVAKGTEQKIEKILSFLENSKLNSKITKINDREIQSEFKGNSTDAAWLLEQLVKNDVPISDYYIKEDNVEDLFFKIGAKKVS